MNTNQALSSFTTNALIAAAFGTPTAQRLARIARERGRQELTKPIVDEDVDADEARRFEREQQARRVECDEYWPRQEYAQ